MRSLALIPRADRGSHSGSPISWAAQVDRLASGRSGGRLFPVGPAPRRTPTVTVVVPCYNYGHFLGECVDSVLSQPGVEVEVLIVDDASPDGSAEVAAAIADRDDRVSLLRHQRNRGHIATYNDGLAEAGGDYVVLLSADDLLTPGALGRATALLEANPGVGMAYGHPVSFTGQPTDPPRTRPTGWLLWSGSDWLGARFRCARNSINSPEVVMRTSVQRQIGGYRPELPHTGDLEMWIRAAAVADVGYVAGADQAWYREHGANMHSTTFRAGDLEGMAIDLRERLRAFESAKRQIDGELPGEELLGSARRALAIEALTLALRAHYWGVAESWPVDELTGLAVEVYPDAARLPQWPALRLQRRLGSGRWRYNPLAVAHEVALRCRFAARGWRLDRVGL